MEPAGKVAVQRSLLISVKGTELHFALRGVAIEKAGGDVIVAIAEDGGGDFDAVAEDALGGIAAVVDGGLDLFDDDALAAFAGFHARYNSFVLCR